MTIHRSLLAASAALAVTVAPVAAQDIAGVRAFHFGARGGVSVPLGNFAETDEDGLRAETGFNAAALLSIRLPAAPIGVRLEASYDRFGTDLGGIEGSEGVDATWTVLAGTLNGTLDVPMQGVVRPYLIAGVGIYRPEFEVSFEGVSGSFDDTRVGFNGGAGLRFGLGGLAAFLEARYHTTTIEVDFDEFGASGSQRINFVPVSFGIEF